MVLLHAFFATAMSWYATVGALAEHYRVFAVDIMGEANRSRPTLVISSRDDYLQWFSELVEGLGLDRMSLVTVRPKTVAIIRPGRVLRRKPRALGGCRRTARETAAMASTNSVGMNTAVGRR